MYELVQAGENTYYIDCPAKVGIYKTEANGVWLIDSGNDKDMARRICKVLDAQGWTLLGIVNTHSHADHIGANAALKRRTGCRILAGGMEAATVRHPLFEPSTLYGGNPMQGLRNKFLMAEASEPDGDLSELPSGLQAFPLPGHSYDMQGIRTADDVMFIADSLFPQRTLDKYHVFFLYDVKAHLATLDWLEGAEAALFIPSHSEAVVDIKSLVHANRQKAQEICTILINICNGICPDDIIKQVFDHYGLEMNLGQYALVGSTIRSYLSYLCDSGQMQCSVRENRLVFNAV